jgi:hypothetical protein
MVAASLNSTDDHLELQVGIVFVQPDLVVRGRIIIVKVHRAPFDVEDSIGRTARNRGEDTAVSARETCATRQTIRTLVLPHREDGEIERPDVGWRRQTR